MNGPEWVPLGRLLKMVRVPVIIDDEGEYRQVGVRGFGRGILDYGTQPASSLSKLRYFDLSDNRLVVSNIKGWEGAVATTKAEEAGRIASNRFLQYEACGDVDLGYVRHWLLSTDGLRALGTASPGSADRNRTLAMKKFEAIEIPLPPLPDQRRIAAHLDSVSRSVAELEFHSQELDAAFGSSSVPRLLRELLLRDPLPMVSVGELVDVVNDTVHPGDDLRGAGVFVGLEHISPHTGRRFAARPVADENGRKFRFEPGDVTYGYLRPYQNKVWVADVIGLCSVEQFVLRPRAGVDSDLLSLALRSSIVLDPVNAATNNLQLPRLRLKTLLGLEIPDVRLLSPEAAGACERVTDTIEQVASVRSQRRSQISSLLPAARNEVFSALR